MKVGGIEVCPAPEEILVLPRGDQQIVFRAKPVTDWDRFNALVPEPIVPVGMVKGEKKLLTDQPDYKAQKERRQMLLTAYMVLESLRPSNIEWDTVNDDEPQTWLNCETDLRDAGLTNVEINLVLDLVQSANQLNEKKLKAARDSFLAGQEAA